MVDSFSLLILFCITRSGWHEYCFILLVAALSSQRKDVLLNENSLKENERVAQSSGASRQKNRIVKFLSIFVNALQVHYSTVNYII